MSEYFPKPESLQTNVKVELDLSNYATKTDFKNATGIDTSEFPKKIDGRIQALFEIGNHFWVHKNWCPNFDRSNEDIILILFNSS